MVRFIKSIKINMVFPQIVYKLIFEMLPANLNTCLYLCKDLKR